MRLAPPVRGEGMATYTASHVANFMLDKAEEEGRPLTQMKLQKLVYIAYGWYLALTGERLFPEPIYAWPHGPVVRTLYDEFKHFGGDRLYGRSVEFDLDSYDETTPRIPNTDKDTNLILNRVWQSYKGFSASQLRGKTHSTDAPWSQIYDERNRNRVIPDHLIAGHFSKRIDAYLDAANA